MSKEVNDLSLTRLKAERKNWRADHPFVFLKIILFIILYIYIYIYNKMK